MFFVICLKIHQDCPYNIMKKYIFCRLFFVIFGLFAIFGQVKASTLTQNYTPTKYINVMQFDFKPNVSKILYSTGKKLMLILIQNDPKFYLYNGNTYDKVGEFTPLQSDSVTAAAFTPDVSLLIVGTSSGHVFTYQIKNYYTIDLQPGHVIQNQNGKNITVIDIISFIDIAVSSNNQDLTFYFTSDRSKKLSFSHRIQFETNINSLKYDQFARNLYVGANFPTGRFSVIDAFYFNTTDINALQTTGVSCSLHYFVQATRQNITIYKNQDKTVVGVIPYPNTKSVQISYEELYLIADDGQKLQVWNIKDLQNPIVFMQPVTSAVFGSDLICSRIMVFDKNQNLLTLYSLCNFGQFYTYQTNQCAPCMNLCDICNYEYSCQDCSDAAYLNQQFKCILCSDSIIGCISCSSSSYCKVCDDKQNFNPSPYQNTCSCKPGYYLNLTTCISCYDTMVGCIDCTNKNFCTKCDLDSNFILNVTSNRCVCKQGYYFKIDTCFSCNSLIEYCTACSQDGSLCTKCDENIHRKPSFDHLSCVCSDFYYQGQDHICQLCDTIQKCRVCQDSNSCKVCNDQNHWVATNDHTCVCKSGYIDSKGLQCLSCNVSGCDKCQTVNSCDICNQEEGFMPNPIQQSQCLCKEHRYKDGQKCLTCSSVMINCDKCTSKTGCTSCVQSFVLSSDKKSCICPQNYSLQNGKCIQNSSNLIEIILIIVGALVLIITGVIMYVKCFKKQKKNQYLYSSQQNFQNQYNKHQQSPRKSKRNMKNESDSLISSLQTDRGQLVHETSPEAKNC